MILGWGEKNEENGVGWGIERKTLVCRMLVTNVEGMTELENHHFVTPNVKSDSDKIHQGMLKPLGEKLFRNKTHLVPKYYPHKLLSNAKGKHIFKKERPGCHHLNKLRIVKNSKTA